MPNAPLEVRAGLVVVHHCANVIHHEEGVGGGFVDRHHDSAEDYLSEERVEAEFIPKEAAESLRRVHMRKVVERSCAGILGRCNRGHSRREGTPSTKHLDY